MHLGLNGARDLLRVGEIAAVLGRHGLGDVLRRLGLFQLLERAAPRALLSAEAAAGTRPEARLRQAFEQLGPTFVKLGQSLAGRSDLLPPAWCEELSRLHEDVAPVPFAELRAQLAQDLGADPLQVFPTLDTEPLAAGSIAQVHRARLEDGTEVVLKVRRPGIEETVEADLRLLTRLAQLVQEREDARAYQPLAVVRQFARVLRAELDLSQEARNAERLRANLGEQAGLVIPRIHATWTRKRLCVMDHLAGPSLGEWLRSGRGDSAEGRRLAAAGASAVLEMVFVHGVFHADPHPGNLVRLADGRLGLLDFGQVGFLSEGRRSEFFELLVAVVERRPGDVAEILLSWSGGELDPELLEADCAEFIDRYQGVPLERLQGGQVLRDVLALVRENGLVLPPDVALLMKVFLTLDGLGRALDPGFVTSEHLAPFTRRALRAARSPLVLGPRIAGELARLTARLPRHLSALRAFLRRGRLPVEVDLRGLDRFAAQLDRSVNHLTIGMILAALIVAASVALRSAGGPTILGVPFFAGLGLASSFGVGLWWILVTHRRR